MTDVIAPENFHMTGPVDFKMNVKAQSRDIQQVVGKFNTRKPGHLRIEKFDDLLAKLIKAKPEPRKKIKTQGKRGPKTPILSR